jgi:exosome complex component RRP4
LGDKRWKVDVGGRSHSILMLSAVNLPGGIQRRRTTEDSLNMRAFFTENDVISVSCADGGENYLLCLNFAHPRFVCAFFLLQAEVQKLRHDGGVSLHTRNLKYGKLSNGSFVSVPSNLIKRCKHHFQVLGEEIGVEVILGMNGFIWIQEAPVEKVRVGKNIMEEDEGMPSTYTPVTAAGRERVCRVRNSILALARRFMPIYNVTITDVYLASVQLGLPAKDMLSSQEIVIRITQPAMERTQQA